MPETIRNVACTVCGCVCDDLAVTVDAGRVVRADGACSLAESWLLRQNANRPPVAAIDGMPADFATAAARAAELLLAARSPLIYGLSRSTTEGQRAATALADRIGATIDTTASTGHAPSIMALQQVGESTCTLGEAKNRADLVIFWGSDPLRTHPRHLERYSADPVGRFVPGGRRDRVIVVVDEEETETVKRADVFVRVEPGRHWEALWELRLRVRGLMVEDGRRVRPVDEAPGQSPEPPHPPGPPLRSGEGGDEAPGLLDTPGAVPQAATQFDRPSPLRRGAGSAGGRTRGEVEGHRARSPDPTAPPPLCPDSPPRSGEGGGDEARTTPEDDSLAALATRMKSCRYGVIFFGSGVTRGPLAHRTVEALLQLVTDLNLHTRFYARRMRRFGDVAGADSVLTWQTGYPFGVNLARGFPRYNPGEFTGPDLLARGEVDVCVVVGGETVADLPDAAKDHLRRIPVILLDAPDAVTELPAAVRFTTAVYGVHRPGTAYRMDEVPIPLRVILPTDYPSDGDVLNELLARVTASASARG